MWVYPPLTPHLLSPPFSLGTTMQATLPLPPAPLQVRSDAVEALCPPSKDMQATRKLRLGWRKLQVSGEVAKGVEAGEGTILACMLRPLKAVTEAWLAALPWPSACPLLSCASLASPLSPAPSPPDQSGRGTAAAPAQAGS